jgi:type II secretion system protein N
MIAKILPWLAGAAWGLLVFLGGLQLFFPSDAAVERLQYQLDEASKGAWQLNAAKASPWRATGLKLKGVELLKIDQQRRGRGDDDEGEGPSGTRFLVADHIALRAQLLPLLGGTKQAAFDADLYKGDLSGTVGLSGDSLGMRGDAAALDLGLIPFEGESMSLDLDGALDASWDLIIDTEDPTKSTGTIELEVEGLRLNSASVAGFDLEETSDFSVAELEIEVEDGKAKVKKGQLEGDLIEAKIDGEITLSKKFDRSRLRLKLEFTLAEHVDMLVKLLPGAKDARRDDGRYHFNVTGTILHPSFRAERERSKATRSSPRSSSPSRPGVLPGSLGGEDEPELDAEERRRLREERIRERRERLRERREQAKAGQDDEHLDDVDRGEEDFRGDDEDYLDDEPRDFGDELPLQVDPYDDVELNDVPFEDDDLGEFEDDF